MNLNLFNTANLFEASTHLFEQLGIKLNSHTAEALPAKDLLKSFYKENDVFHSIKSTYFIGIIDDSIFQDSLTENQYSIHNAIEQGNKNYNGLMFFALELSRYLTRTEISELTRAFNRISQKMPIALLLKYPPISPMNEPLTSLLKDLNTPPLKEKNSYFISIAISERFKYLQNWRQGEKVGKVIILRDINTQNPHAGHIRILQDLVKPVGVTTYEQLHQHWLQVLDVEILNKKFFQELSNWYFAAMKEVTFPDDLEKNEELRNATNLIRLITRVIFIWFIKEKQLVPASLFQKEFISTIIKDFNKDKQSHNYYNAILQNLFFGTLNQKVEERKFAKEGNYIINKEEYGVKNLFRYADLFTISEKEVLELFRNVPFLNGGLFDCLDKPNEKNKILYVDGFSRNSDKKAKVPDYLFFGEETETDLNEIYGTKNKKYSFRGLIHLLNSYKFTVAENTPIEEEIALDPELLGKVFENLLASYNPETQTTARKQTGSFYTPREIVNYMVEESLVEYLKGAVRISAHETFEERLRDLLSYSENPNPFNQEETKALIKAISDCKILDPACGSGAFPMGILHKMVHLLQKLDPLNQYWKQIQKDKIIGNEIKKLEQDQKLIEGLSNEQVREKALQAVKQQLQELEEIFNKSYHFDDYSRKLYLIENCIYGIDIQPIAVQITKLRFFISLVIDQNIVPKSLLENKDNNFGIRPLPNLETKFVAANTLIGLDKPQQQTIRNPQIAEKENELKELRHQYFTANNRNLKIKLQRKDKEIREEIVKMLESDGWETRVAQQISVFDPYDQNHFANWFDPEWMFGLTTGFDIIIGNPPYIQLQKDGGRLAQELQNQGYQTFARTGDIYTLFYEKGIQLLKPGGHLTFITSNKWMRAGYGEKTRAFFAKYNPIKLIDLGSGIFESATVDTNILIIQKAPNQNHCQAADLSRTKQTDFENLTWNTLNKLGKDAWFIGNNAEQKLKEKIEKIGKPLKDWDINIYRGILTGYNKAFIIDGKKKDELIAQDPRSAEILKPILRGRDIQRYKADFADLWLINTHNGVKEKGIPRIDVEKDYPAIYQHLKQYEPQLKKRQDKGDHWTNLRNCAYLQEFEKEKIVYSEIVREPQFYLDNGHYYPEATVFIITGKYLKFLIGCIQSKLLTYVFKKFYSGGGLGEDGFRYKKQFLEQLPVSLPTETEQQPFVALVEQILSKKEKGEDTTALERAIDHLVYSLYDLTEEEIQIIENTTK